MNFEFLGPVLAVQTIATGSGIREIARLRRRYGRGRWRKRKGIAEIRLASGEIVRAGTLVRGHRHWETGIQDQKLRLRYRNMARMARQLVICIDNSGYEVSLERRKIYVSVRDARAEKSGHVRVIDESGEDYLYPQESFVTADLPQSIRRAVLLAV